MKSFIYIVINKQGSTINEKTIKQKQDQIIFN